MKASRYSTSRQKACQPCSHAKAKCNRGAGSCSRCTARGLLCTYPQTAVASGSDVSSDPDQVSMESLGSPTFPGLRPSDPARESLPAGHSPGSASSATVTEALRVGQNVSAELQREDDGLNFSALSLVCPIDVDGISVRWMNPYIPVPGQTVKAYPPTTIAFVRRVLKSYAAMAIRGRSPPFVHPTQLATASPSPMATCLNLSRICDRSLPGSQDVAADVLMREMDSLYERHVTLDDTASLAAFQAYLVYAMVLCFHLGRGAVDSFLRRAVMALQEMACSSARRGLVCVAEQQRARPRWEAWVVAEAKRRTLYVLYLFDSVLSAQDGLPTFLGTELRGMYAPASKNLWQRDARSAWEAAYNVHLVDWAEGDLCIDELWPIPADFDETSISRRRARVDRWLEGVDEFGTMIYAVTSITHGG